MGKKLRDTSMRLKAVRSRRLRDGRWVVVAEGSEPIVTTETVAHDLGGEECLEASLIEAQLTEALVEAGFVSEDADISCIAPPKAPRSVTWRAARGSLWVVSGLLVAIAAWFLVRDGLPTGLGVASAGPSPALALTAAIGVAIVTSVPHELAHVVFGRTTHRRFGSVRLDTKRAAATTSLTHVWAWPLSARLAALCAGLVVDLGFLVMFLVVRASTDAWIATVGIAVLVMRIVWQLRFHRNCDGRHAAKMLFDNPVIEDEVRREFAERRWTGPSWVPLVWKSLMALGVLAEVSLFLVWVAPAILRLVGLL